VPLFVFTKVHGLGLRPSGFDPTSKGSRFTVSRFALFFISISESIRVPFARPQYLSRQAGFNLHLSPTMNREPLNREHAKDRRTNREHGTLLIKTSHGGKNIF